MSHKLTKADLAEIAAKQAARDLEHDEFFESFENAEKNKRKMRALGGGNNVVTSTRGNAIARQKHGSRPATPSAMRAACERYVAA